MLSRSSERIFNPSRYTDDKKKLVNSDEILLMPKHTVGSFQKLISKIISHICILLHSFTHTTGNSHLEQFPSDNSRVRIIRMRVVQMGNFPKTDICRFRKNFIRPFANDFFYQNHKFVSRKKSTAFTSSYYPNIFFKSISQFSKLLFNHRRVLNFLVFISIA